MKPKKAKPMVLAGNSGVCNNLGKKGVAKWNSATPLSEYHPSTIFGGALLAALQEVSYV